MAEIAHPIYTSFAKGELSPSMYGRVDLQYYTIGTRVMLNYLVHPQGGVSNTPGTQYIAPVKTATDPVKLIPFEFSTTQAYMLEFGDYYMRVYKDKTLVMNGAVPYELVTPYSKSDVFKLRFTQSANVLFITCPGKAPKEITRTSDTAWTITDFAYENGPFLDENIDDTTLTLSAISGSTGSYGESVKVTASAGMFAAGDVGRWIKIRYIRDEEIIYRANYDWNTTLPHYSDVWTLNGTFEIKYKRSTSGSGATEFQFSRDNGTTWTIYDILDDGSGSWNLISGEITQEDGDSYTPKVRFCDPVDLPDPNNVTIRFKKKREEKIGYLKITGYTSSTVVTCLVKKACNKLDTPLTTWSLGAWGAIPGYPETVMFYQDRLAYANTPTQKNRIDLSKTGDYSNFGTEVELQDDDGISVPLPSRSVNAINNLIPMREMLAFTSGGIWSIAPGSNGDALTPNSMKSGIETGFKAGTLPPIVIGNIVFYAQYYLNKIYSLAYSDTVYGYDGVDMSVASNHLFEGYTLVDWSYQQEPWSAIWAARSDGTLLGFTFLKEQQVQAWYRRTMASGGKVESVAVIPGTTQDDVYFEVARTVNGSTVRYIECMAVRDATTLEGAWFVDSGIEYDSTPVTTVTGLTHLIGCSVSGVADGVAFSGKTVDASGHITLDTAASHVIVGLPYTSDLQTLDIEIGMDNGTLQGRKKRVGVVTLRLQNSKGGYVGPDADHLMPIRYPSGATYPYTGDVELVLNSSYDASGRIFIRQSEPYPITINAIIPDVIIGG